MVIIRPLNRRDSFIRPATVGPTVASRTSSVPVFVAPFGMCCLFCILLAIAAMIVVALIPIYLPSRRVNVLCESDLFTTKFNLNNGVLPDGPASTSDQDALRAGVNGWLSSQSGFSGCLIQVRQSTVSSCPTAPSVRRKRRIDPELSRYQRQTSIENCISQQFTTISNLNCGCTCVGICLDRKVEELITRLRLAEFFVLFPSSNTGPIGVTGIDVPLTLTTTSTSSTTLLSSAILG